eukprot:CAMPEP_0184321926 /NCGR_PEP_ID=MMETSP1049-20130417/121886_1 /TAXON_ID=77928 /ORGANISM="Proteomonas sulcata, Strain CCMP704" /LENGTH=197 /DNA_ID=CAMNT_0026642905 /DNA_START=66 /DNA_END=659 /DNA_ORIENTATION=+
MALAVCLDSALLLSDFTTEPSQILTQVKELEASGNFETLDMTSVANVLKEAQGSSGTVALRGILFYTRACMPSFGGDQNAWNELTASPNFVLDTIYLHSSSHDKQPQVKDFFSALDPKAADAAQRRFYCLDGPISDRRSVFRMAAQLSAHPKLRPADPAKLVNTLVPAVPRAVMPVGGPVAGGDAVGGIAMGLPVVQ